MGQMRVQFNFKTYVVEPAYRDDNQGIWDFGDMGEPSPDDDDVVMQGARLADGERRHRSAKRSEEAEPPAGEEETGQADRAVEARTKRSRKSRCRRRCATTNGTI